MVINLEQQVAIVTGAGTGLGRAHALALAKHGATVIVNDVELPAGDLKDQSTAESVAREIRAAGGRATAALCDVSDEAAVRAMVNDIITEFGRIDILINNAGILRDKSFGKSDLVDFRKVIEVHVMGSVNCSHAVWPHMVQQGYGRVLMTTSASGIYGNFGQANYGTAKSALVGLMNVLAIEGEAKNIRVNALAPTAATQMTQDLLAPEQLALLEPETITPGAIFMVSSEAPTKTILAAGAGVFATARMEESEGVFLPEHERTAENIADKWALISDMTNSVRTEHAFEQTSRYIAKIQHDSVSKGALL